MFQSFFSKTTPFTAPQDQAKPFMKMDYFSSPLHAPQDYTRNRLPSFDTPSAFIGLKDEKSFFDMPDGFLSEPFSLDGGFFDNQHHQQLDQGFEAQFFAKPHDYSADFYRVNRSRGPSFNLGPGRKISEDFPALGFDFSSLCKDQTQLQKNFALDGLDLQHPDLQHTYQQGFQDNQIKPNIKLEGDSQASTHETFASPPRESVVEPVQNLPETRNNKTSAKKLNQPQNIEDFEPKNKKKKKLNNNQAEVVPETAPLKKSKSEVKPQSKSTKGKKDTQKEPVKMEADERSTVTSSIHQSPNFGKQDAPNLVKAHSVMLGGFGTFKKPETAQELLDGLNLPAEVEAYINKSKIFNQLKAPAPVKKIGTLTVEERRIKIEKYLEKRKSRTWSRRVNYDCRKKVADNRLRIKGRFVTKEQAFAMLEGFGIQVDAEKLTNTEIKDLLTERLNATQASKKGSLQGTDNKFALQEKRVADGNEGNGFGFEDKGVPMFEFQNNYLGENYFQA